MMLMQEVRCPVCRGTWELEEKEYVAVGDALSCKYGCGSFNATRETVNCCLEDADGIVFMGLPKL